MNRWQNFSYNWVLIMIYFIFLELTPEYVFSSFCDLGCECMFLPRLDSPVSFFFYLSSFCCKFHLLQPYPFIPAIEIDFSSDLSLCLWFSQWFSNCMCVPFWVHNAWRYWCWNVSARQSGEGELKMMNGWRYWVCYHGKEVKERQACKTFV